MQVGPSSPASSSSLSSYSVWGRQTPPLPVEPPDDCASEIESLPPITSPMLVPANPEWDPRNWRFVPQERLPDFGVYTLWQLGVLANYAYSDPQTLPPFGLEALFFAEDTSDSSNPYAYYGRVLLDRANKTLFVVHRGTVVTEIGNFSPDASIAEGILGERLSKFLKEYLGISSERLASLGQNFFQRGQPYADALSDQARDYVLNQEGSWKIVHCGHSLGATYSQMCATRQILEFYDLDPSQKQKLNVRAACYDIPECDGLADGHFGPDWQTLVEPHLACIQSSENLVNRWGTPAGTFVQLNPKEHYDPWGVSSHRLETVILPNLKDRRWYVVQIPVPPETIGSLPQTPGLLGPRKKALEFLVQQIAVTFLPLESSWVIVPSKTSSEPCSIPESLIKTRIQSLSHQHSLGLSFAIMRIEAMWRRLMALSKKKKRISLTLQVASQVFRGENSTLQVNPAAAKAEFHFIQAFTHYQDVVKTTKNQWTWFFQNILHLFSSANTPETAKKALLKAALELQTTHPHDLSFSLLNSALKQDQALSEPLAPLDDEVISRFSQALQKTHQDTVDAIWNEDPSALEKATKYSDQLPQHSWPKVLRAWAHLLTKEDEHPVLGSHLETVAQKTHPRQHSIHGEIQAIRALVQSKAGLQGEQEEQDTHHPLSNHPVYGQKGRAMLESLAKLQLT